MKNIFAFYFSLLVLLAAACSQDSNFIASNFYLPKTTVSINGRTQNEAITLALESYSRFYPETKGYSPSKDIESVIPFVSSSTKSSMPDTLFYIVNFGENDGFAIISFDETLEPVLVITESGHYDGEMTGNVGFNIYMDDLISQLSLRGIDDPIYPIDSYNYLDTLRYSEYLMSPLLESAWKQDGPFNAFVGSNFPAGCTPVAVGQVMAYYQHPDTLNLSFAGAPVSSITLDWDNMVHHNSHNTSSCPTCLLNALLVREIGERLHTEYGPQSGTSLYNTNLGLPFLGYSHSQGYPYSDEDDLDRIIAALDDDIPVLAFAYFAVGSGHTWVIDGYHYLDKSINYYRFISFNMDGSMNLDYGGHDEETSYYLHFNLGEGGPYNGYYICYQHINKTGIIFPVNQQNLTTVHLFYEIDDHIPNHNTYVITDMVPNN